MKKYRTDILVVGGGTGGTVAAIQAARQGLASNTQVILVSEFSWLGGMLTSAGVTAPDGNELSALQTGIWGDFIRTVQQQQTGGVDHGWVSCFTFEPRVGAEIFAEWVQALPNLCWITGQVPVDVGKTDNRITSVTFADYDIEASIIIDGTELGDVMALADMPHRWGWDWPEVMAFDEPSAPYQSNPLTQTYPVQLPTWVVVMQDFGEGAIAPEIPAPPLLPSFMNPPDEFSKAWEGYGQERFMSYGRLPGDRFMINWPQCGNDYGTDLDRLVASEDARQEWLQEARWHTQAFARHIQRQLGQRYGLAINAFPKESNSLGGGAYALHPYYRESRRIKGLVTVQEQDILPVGDSGMAALPVNGQGEIEAIAIGNYANDHHYPAPESDLLKLQPKSMRWGGRWTGTPFALPYRCLIPDDVDGFLVCEKNISVSHIANGATRLQPTVMNIGQAAGMAAALCIERRCQPRELPVRELQEALLTDAIAPAAVIPLVDVPPQHPEWLTWQRHYLKHGLEAVTDLRSVGSVYPTDSSVKGADAAFNATSQCSPATVTHQFSSLETHPPQSPLAKGGSPSSSPCQGGDRGVVLTAGMVPRGCIQWVSITGDFERRDDQSYWLRLQTGSYAESFVNPLPLITLNPDVNHRWAEWPNHTAMTVMGYWNTSGPWLRTEHIQA